MANEVEVALLLQQVARARRVAAQYLGPDEDEDVAEFQGGALEELQREKGGRRRHIIYISNYPRRGYGGASEGVQLWRCQV